MLPIADCCNFHVFFILQVISTKDKKPSEVITELKKLKPAGKGDPVPAIVTNVKKAIKDPKVSETKLPNFVEVLVTQNPYDPKRVSKEIGKLTEVSVEIKVYSETFQSQVSQM